jgi:hypothetical protein
MSNPLRPTSEVYDESVVKVEFLPAPTQIPDYSLNLNTEALLQKIATIMTNVFGPVRVQGFDVSVSGGNVLVQPGLILHSVYALRLNSQVSFTRVAQQRVVYAKIRIQKL